MPITKLYRYLRSIVLPLSLLLAVNSASPCTVAAQETGALKPGPEALSLQESFSRVAAAVEPAVVNISTLIEEKPPQYEFYFGAPSDESGGRGQPPARRAQAVASGVIVNADGYILTNEHVVRDAKAIQVTLAGGKKFRGKLVGRDARTDLAIIRIKTGGKLPFARLGDSDRIKVGDWVIAVGSPFGLEETVTAGIISAKRQSLSIEGSTYTNLIQTDAAINMGNSGGPLCNINGEVIGLATAIYAPTGVFSGIGFAIPINNVKDIMDSLINKGKVVRGWLGIEARPIDDAIARHFGLADTRGVLVNDVLPRTPAADAGMKRGDVVRAINGNPINSPQDLQTMVAKIEPRTTITVDVVRNRKPVSLKLVTGEAPSDEEMEKQAEKEEEAAANNARTPGVSGAALDTAEVEEWQGMAVVTATDEITKKLGLPAGEKGCIVAAVSDGSPAGDMEFLPGDIIRSVNKTVTPTVKEFRRATARLNPDKGAVFDVNRRGHRLYLSLPRADQMK